MAKGKSAADRSELAFLERALHEGYDADAWHGPTLRGSLRRVRAAEAAWEPDVGRHSIWALALHCAYWKHRVRCRVTGEESRFARGPSNFPAIPDDRSERAWREDLALLDATHAALLEALRSLDPSSLGDAAPRRSRRDQILGAAFHDVYHAGQIRLIRRLAGG
ncbi:MAG: DinB family protein [Gemmatimonadota bacterium]